MSDSKMGLRYFSMVDWSGEDHFACGNYDWLWITSVLKEYVRWYIFPNTRELFKAVLVINIKFFIYDII